jgi:hypothetical protein
MSEEKRPGGPDLTQDVRPAEFTEGKLFGHVADESASGAGRLGDTRNSYCSRYHGSLADGPVVDDTIRRPWHHACFSLRTGEATRPPALSSLSVWQLQREGDKVFVRRRLETPSAAGCVRLTHAGRS